MVAYFLKNKKLFANAPSAQGPWLWPWGGCLKANSFLLTDNRLNDYVDIMDNVDNMILVNS
jgi:hypothetical protein